MRRAIFTVVCFCVLFTVIVSAQARKAGLWETTTNMSFQQSPFPQMPAQANGHAMPGGSPFGGPHTTQVCVTQAQIDKYNAIYNNNSPQQRDCQMSNIVKTANGMTADMVCTGRMNGKASVHFTWSDGDHSTGTIHFTGTMQMGPNSMPVEWTNTISSVFKSADCGSVKPFEPPPAH